MASSQATSFPVAPDQEQNRALVVVTSSCRKLVLVMGMMLWALESPWRPAESKVWQESGNWGGECVCWAQGFSLPEVLSPPPGFPEANDFKNSPRACRCRGMPGH
ncbi:uncharacterized protein ACOB7L_003347 isoform 1-T1 [Callospermophilus lateralis]|uniref:uncharacterized protein LOC143638346 isoform X1 n=1 Tax=Callospermophilus lateralis TaxID=76772 RepID=UPI0040546F33